MKPEETHFKYCTDKGIRIYPVPVSASNNGDYHIVVERKNRANKGKLVFKDKPKPSEPSVWQQIRTLYKMIYEEENTNTSTTP